VLCLGARAGRRGGWYEVGEGFGAQGRASQQRRLGRAQTALCSLRARGAELGGPREKHGFVQQGAAVMCCGCGGFQFGGDVLGGREGGRGQVPRRSLLVIERTRGGGQHAVCLPPCLL
jgi:hypothetical protein